MPKVTFFHMREKDFSNLIYRDLYSDLIDLRDFTGTYIMCDFETLDRISKEVEEENPNKLVYLGNGNYHYMTLTLLRQFKKPYTLVTFDHHHDAWLNYPQMTSCSSWVHTAIENLPFLKEVIVVGAGTSNLPQSLSNLKILDENTYSQNALYKLSQIIKTKNIYLSIDRDFLSKKEVQTNWDQGQFQLAELLNGINILLKNHTLIGADVCGDLLWDYQTTNSYSMQPMLEKSIQVNKEIFNFLKHFL